MKKIITEQEKTIQNTNSSQAQEKMPILTYNEENTNYHFLTGTDR